MAEKHDRFRRLERPREEAPKAAPLSSGRFGAPAPPPPSPGEAPSPEELASPPPEAPEPEPEPAPPSVDPEEARAAMRERREAQLQSGVELDEQLPGDQPFIRCGQCEADSYRSVVRCSVCGARLDTPEQRAFNEAWWAKQREERAKQEAELEAMKARAPEAWQPGGGQRDYGATLAAQVADRERERLSWMDDGGGHRDLTPVGMRLLNKIPDARWRLAAAAGLLAAAVGLGVHLFGSPQGERNPYLTLLFFGICMLFMPARPWSRRPRRWF